MNHIIHAATHPSWRLEPYANDQEMFREVEAYLDLIVSQVRRAAASAPLMPLHIRWKVLGETVYSPGSQLLQCVP
jgi:hypothetical protein